MRLFGKAIRSEPQRLGDTEESKRETGRQNAECRRNQVKLSSLTFVFIPLLSTTAHRTVQESLLPMLHTTPQNLEESELVVNGFISFTASIHKLDHYQKQKNEKKKKKPGTSNPTPEPHANPPSNHVRIRWSFPMVCTGSRALVGSWLSTFTTSPLVSSSNEYEP